MPHWWYHLHSFGGSTLKQGARLRQPTDNAAFETHPHSCAPIYWWIPSRINCCCEMQTLIVRRRKNKAKKRVDKFKAFLLATLHWTQPPTHYITLWTLLYCITSNCTHHPQSTCALHICHLHSSNFNAWDDAALRCIIFIIKISYYQKYFWAITSQSQLVILGPEPSRLCYVGIPHQNDKVFWMFLPVFSVRYIYMPVQQCYIYWWSDHTMHQQLELNIKNSYFPSTAVHIAPMIIHTEHAIYGP